MSETPSQQDYDHHDHEWCPELDRRTALRLLSMSTLAAVVGCGRGNLSTSADTTTGTTATTTTLTASASTVIEGASITLTATVSPSAATGTVTFYDGTTILGTGTLSSGTATLATKFHRDWNTVPYGDLRR